MIGLKVHLADQMRGTMSKHSRLTRTRSRQDQDRPRWGCDSFNLLGIKGSKYVHSGLILMGWQIHVNDIADLSSLL